MAGMGRKAVLARADFSITRTEVGKISWWWQGAWPFVTCELTIDQCGKGRYALKDLLKGL
jgi:hypothetical protein